MIKDNQRLLNKIHLLIDVLMIVGSYILMWYLKFEVEFFGREEGGVLSKNLYFELLFFIVPLFIFWYYLFQIYTPKRTIRKYTEIGVLLQANISGVITIYSILYLLKEEDYSRTLFIYFAAANFVLASIYRLLLRKTLQRFREKGYNQKHVLLVGYSKTTEQYIDRVKHNPDWGYQIYGILDDHMDLDEEYDGVKCLGKIDSLMTLLNHNQLDEIAITISLHDYDRLEEIVTNCEKSGVHTKFIPDYNTVIPSRPYTEDLQGLPVIHIRHVPLTNTGNMLAKRVVDFIGALVALIIFTPAMIVCAILVKTGSDGPLLFKQERIGLHNKPFLMYKFRSMELQKESDEAKGWTVQNDPRVTKIGRLMRKTSLDELPQLFNILKGEMSLVGPRPERPQFVEKFKEQIPRYMIKHQVRPGMTGWAQINGFRGDTSIRKRIDYDIYYIENWTMGLDLKILITTIFKGFINKNAY
ncbi:MAG: undecaprenyl-phosphate glucose phosphotransferase [Lachnospiraceae bacterium]